MMLLTKLKTIAVVALTAAALTGGLGLGLIPARAAGPGDDPAPAPATARAAKADPPAIPPADAPDKPAAEVTVEWKFDVNEQVDDVVFLKRLSLALRNEEPTDIETFFFVADGDENKRVKVIEWMTDDDTVREHAAKKAGVAADRVRVVRALTDGKEGRPGTVVLLVRVAEQPQPRPRVQALAFSPDGRALHAEPAQTFELRGADGKWVELKADAKDAVRTRVARLTADGKPLEWKNLQNIPGGDHLRLNLNVVEDRDVLMLFADGDDPKNPNVRVWDVDGKKVVVAGADGKQAHAISPDGKKVVVVGPDGVVRVWDAATGQAIGDDGKKTAVARLEGKPAAESDLDWLKRVTTAARGTPPTALEEKYFTEDKDPKKREKLIDSLLKEPEVAKKLGDDFKKRMMAGPAAGAAARVKEDVLKYFVVPGKDGQKFEFKFPEGFPFNPKDGPKLEFKVDPKVVPFLPKDLPFKFEIELGPDGKPLPPKVQVPAVPPVPPVPGAKVQPPQPPVPPQPQAQGDKLGKLVDELLAAKKSDAEMLEALTLATAGRLPTDVEKRLTLGLVAKSSDRKAAWLEVAKAMAGTGGKQVEVELKLVKP